MIQCPMERYCLHRCGEYFKDFGAPLDLSQFFCSLQAHIRLGLTKITHDYQYLMERGTPQSPLRQTCQVLVTVQLLIDCPQYNAARR